MVRRKGRPHVVWGKATDIRHSWALLSLPLHQIESLPHYGLRWWIRKIVATISKSHFSPPLLASPPPQSPHFRRWVGTAPIVAHQKSTLNRVSWEQLLKREFGVSQRATWVKIKSFDTGVFVAHLPVFQRISSAIVQSVQCKVVGTPTWSLSFRMHHPPRKTPRSTFSLLSRHEMAMQAQSRMSIDWGRWIGRRRLLSCSAKFIKGMPQFCNVSQWYLFNWL